MYSVIHYIKKHKFLLAVIVPAALAHMLVSLPSGSHFCYQDKCGLFFWGAHGHDAIWHLAIVAASFSKFPFSLPIFSGANLYGYNYLLDILIFIFTRVGIDASLLYFKIFPLLWFVLIIWSAVRLGRKQHDSPLFVGILLFFIFFAGSFSYLLTFYHHGTIWDSAGLLAMQPGLDLVNLQFAFSLVAMLMVIYELRKNKPNHFLLSLLNATILALKFYGGIISLFLTVFYLAVSGMRQKKTRHALQGILIILSFSAMVVYLFYNPFTGIKTSAGLVFSPMSTIHPVIEERELYYLPDTVNARYFLQNAISQSKKISPKLIWIETLTVFIFIVFNFGTRIIAVPYFIYKLVKRKLDLMEASLFLSILLSLSLTGLFVQKGVWWNTIQFMYYGLFLASLLAAESVYLLANKKNIWKIILLSIILILTIPNALDTVKGFASYPAPSYLPDGEQKALGFLKNQSEGVVYAPIMKNKDNPKKSPRALAYYDDTSYISAFSGKTTYIADETQLTLLNIDYKSRLEQTLKNPCSAPIEARYIYLIKTGAQCDPKTFLGSKKIFENKDVIILKR